MIYTECLSINYVSKSFRIFCKRPQNRIKATIVLDHNDVYSIGVDLAEILGGRMASAEGGLVPRGVGYGEGCPFRS